MIFIVINAPLYYTNYVGLFSLCILIQSGTSACNATSTCCSPELPTESAGNVRQITETKDTYQVDEIVGYFCDNKNGHLSVTCQGSNIWTDVDRTCDGRYNYTPSFICHCGLVGNTLTLEHRRWVQSQVQADT